MRSYIIVDIGIDPDGIESEEEEEEDYKVINDNGVICKEFDRRHEKR